MGLMDYLLWFHHHQQFTILKEPFCKEIPNPGLRELNLWVPEFPEFIRFKVNLIIQ